MIFYNTNVQLSLLNATTTNVNQPAEYKIKFTINANGTSDTLTTTDVVIKADDVVTDTNSSYGYSNGDGGAKYRAIDTIAAVLTPTTFQTFLFNDKFKLNLLINELVNDHDIEYLIN